MADISQAPEGLDEFLAQPSPSLNQQPINPNEPKGLNEFIAPEMQEAQFGTPIEQAKAGLEGIAKGIAGPLAPMAEQAMGVSPEAIRARAEVNPATHIAGEIGGLATGLGLGRALGAIGAGAEAAAGALGIGKIGSAVAKGAIENLAFQAQDEVSKLVLGDPNQTVETAVADMGLASLLGGGISSVPALWKAGLESKTYGTLKAFANKLGGIEGAIPEAAQDLADRAGIQMAPEIKVGLSEDPYVRQAFSTLEQTDTSKSGLEFQKNYAQFKKDAGDAMITAFGKTPEDVKSLGEISKYDAGKNIGTVLAKEYEAQTDRSPE